MADRKLQDGESIQIKIGKDGSMVMRAIGVRGGACTQVTKPFEQLGEVISDRPTPDMRLEEETNETRNRARR